MATANGGWETVGNKKTKTQKAPLPKSKKKTFAESMPKIIPVLPVKESPTIYDAFIKEEQKQERKLEMEKEQQAKSGKGKQAVATGGKKSVPDRKKEPPTLENTVPHLELEEIVKVLDKVKTSFPANPEVWLKDLASLMNLSLDKIPDTDPVYEGKPPDFPMCLLASDVEDLLLQTISMVSAAGLDSFLDHCIESIFNDQMKNIPSHGCRLFIQLLLHHKPETAIKSLNKYLTMLQKNQTRPLRNLALLWIIGQAGITHLGNGLKIWLTLMFPVLNQRNLLHYIVDYLDSLFRLHSDLKTGFGAVQKADFFKLFSELYADQPNLPSDVQKRLKRLYPKIRAVAWGDVTTNLHNYFSSFLARCTPDCNDNKRFELLNCLVTCLTMDVQSFSIWRQIYHKQMAPSSILLNHLAICLSDLGINRKVLRETVRAFHLTNEELAADPAVSKLPEYGLAVTSCKELLAKLNKIAYPWSMFLLLVLFLFMAAFTADAYSSGSIEKSRTYRILEEAGVLYFLRHAWTRISNYSSKIYTWIDANVPGHVNKVWQIISPYCYLMWEKLLHLFVFVSESTKAQRQWIVEKLDIYLPVVLEFLGHWTSVALLWIGAVVSWLWSALVYYFMAATDWLLENVFIGSLHPENILAKLSSLLSSVTPYFVSAYSWLVSLFQ